MGKLANAAEELMGDQSGQPQQQMPAPAGMGKPQIRLKGQPAAPMDPSKAQANLGAAVGNLGQAVQGAIDSRMDDQARRAGDPNMQLQHAQPQPPRSLPQDRMRQMQDQQQLKQGKLPKDLDKDVAQVAVNAARQANSRAAGGAPMESVTEGTNKKAMSPFKPDYEASNPDKVAGYDEMQKELKAAFEKHKNQIKGDGPDKISHMGRDGAGNPKQWKVLTSPDSLKSKPLPATETVLSVDARDKLLDEVFGG